MTRPHLRRDLTGTRWARRRDGICFTVVLDPYPPTNTSRSLVLRNENTGRIFRATPEGLHRKYRPDTGTTDPADPEEKP